MNTKKTPEVKKAKPAAKTFKEMAGTKKTRVKVPQAAPKAAAQPKAKRTPKAKKVAVPPEPLRPAHIQYIWSNSTRDRQMARVVYDEHVRREFKAFYLTPALDTPMDTFNENAQGVAFIRPAKQTVFTHLADNAT